MQGDRLWLTYLGDVDGVTVHWFWPGPALVVEGIWGVNQHIVGSIKKNRHFHHKGDLLRSSRTIKRQGKIREAIEKQKCGRGLELKGMLQQVQWWEYGTKIK